jgi:sulfite exporter TauE/SafE
MGNIDLIVIISVAFLASIGHCIGMCGGIVIAYSSKIGQKASYWQQTFSHLAYNLGRVTTYTIMGAIIGYLGQLLSVTPTTKGILFALTGVLMILAGLSLLGNLKFLNSAEWSISQYGWYQRSFKKLLSLHSYSSFYRLGVLNGMIPCGLVYSFAILAASTATPWGGASVMAIFGLMTIPALFFLGFVTKYLQQSSWRSIMMKLSAILIILYGIFTLIKGYKFISNPEKMQAMMQKMQSKHDINATINGKFNGMKCEMGKCG